MRRRTLLSQALALSAGMAFPQSGRALAQRAGARALNILILGGTNFVGPAVVEQAMARGHNVTLFNRGITRPELFADLEKLRGLRGMAEQDLSALKGRRRWDAVVDVWPEQSRLVEATARLLADRVDYYSFVSSIAVYQDFSEAGIDEAAPVRRGESGYGGEKVTAESIVADIYDKRYGVARCHSIFGPRDPGSTLHYWLRRFSRYDEVVTPGDGRDPVQFVDVRDVASWIVASIERKLTGVHNLAASPLSFREFIEACRRAVSSSSELAWVNAEFIYNQGYRSFDELPLWIPRREDPGFFGINAKKAEDAGMRFRPHDETIAVAWRWYQSAFFKDTQFPHNGWGISRQREEALMQAWRQRG